MEIKSLLELPGLQSSLSYYETPEVVLSLYDKTGNVYRLELRNRKEFYSIRKKRISWCNGWQLESKLLQTVPSVAVVEDPILALKILNEASCLLNGKYFPSIIFPDYGKYIINNIISLSPICDSFEHYSENLINDKTTILKNDDKDYLKNISIQQLIIVLNCYDIIDNFIIKEKKNNESKILHQYRFEYVLVHSDVFDFPMKEKYSELYNVSFSFHLYSDIDYSINERVEAKLTFDYFNLNNTYVFNYIGTNQLENSVIMQPNNKAIDSRCFVVTAVTGDVNHPIVNRFRSFRDDYLLEFNLGVRFVDFYYKISPPFANLISKSKFLKVMVLCFIIKPISFFLRIQSKNNN